jgi:hypothetical protein
MTKPDPKRFIDLARSAAVETAGEKAVSNFIDVIDEGEGAFSYIFESKLDGYQGWQWSVTIFDAPDGNQTISEVVLLPGDKALLAPAWVPWSERLADWKALQAELEAQAALEATELAEAESEEGDDDDADEEAEADSDEVDADFEDVPDEDSQLAEDNEERAQVEAEGSDQSLATTDLEPGEDAEDDSEDAGGKPPLFSRWGRRRNKNKKR